MAGSQVRIPVPFKMCTIEQIFVTLDPLFYVSHERFVEMLLFEREN